MSRVLLVLFALILLSGVLLGDQRPLDVSKLPPAATAAMEFQRDVQPILARACFSCHGPMKQSSGLRLDVSAAALKGGNSGPVIIPGKSAESRLLHLVAGLDAELKMPPKGPALTPEEIGKLRAWIDQGARFPKDDAAAGVAAKSNHWAFQPPKRGAPPAVSHTAWVRNEIDAFILARLDAEKLAPSPEAERSTLIRRLSFDLLGLPPTLTEVEAFLHDTHPEAYDRLVDRLLASPSYGERWARHWLDLARYADSDGYEKDTGRPFAWRYRQWVIDALNRDLPFDQFTIEQLAGDLLPGATAEQKVATGFHRNTLTNREGGVDQEQFRVEAVVDRVNTTAKVFLGVTLGCAQCHDHKYDPLSQRDYYQMFAFFNSDTESNIPAPMPDEQEPYQRKKAEHAKKKTELDAAVATYRKDSLAAAQQKWEAELKLPELRKLPDNVRAALLVEPDKRDEQQKKAVVDAHAKADKRLAQLTKAVADHAKTAPTLTQAQTLALGSPRKTHVLVRGDFLRPGVEVEPGIPTLFAPLARLGQGAGGDGSKPTRLDLARWLVEPGNPLTARVVVNWVWHKHFGRGLVPTLEDFGTQGEKPSHPELLDWLATELVRRQWSLKSLHRLIVTSATYRQSSQQRPELLARDPLNVLRARQSRLRLEGEVLRDNALAVSGLLAPRIGGPSVRPPQPAGIADLSYAGSVKWTDSTGPDRYRRGLYTWFQRTSPYPMLMTFDSPDSNVCCVRRERTNTPLQALTLLNDTVFVECAQALARRVQTENGARSVSEALRHAFRLCLAREPTTTELATLERLFAELLKDAQSHPEVAAKLAGPPSPDLTPAEAAAWVALARAIMNLDEFMTRE
jgi:mono/diheme cytochrome c family protein